MLKPKSKKSKKASKDEELYAKALSAAEQKLERGKNKAMYVKLYRPGKGM